MVELQELQSVDVEDVEAAASVHEHFGKSGVADDRVDDKRVLPGVWNIIGVVIPIKGDCLPRLIEIPGGGHLD